MTLAILCSGQGGQHRDMFALTGDAPEATHLFAHAATLLGGRDPRDFVRSESDEALHRNRSGQILCTLQALAAAAGLEDIIPHGAIIAGYSVGEVAAWGVGDLFEPVLTLDLAVRRAEAMDAATCAGDGLIFVRGLSHDDMTAPLRAPRCGDRHRQSRRCLRDRRWPGGIERNCRRGEGDACHKDRRSAGSGCLPHRTARRGVGRVSRSLAVGAGGVPVGRRCAHPERHRWRFGRLRRDGPRQARRADLANRAVGEIACKAVSKRVPRHFSNLDLDMH